MNKSKIRKECIIQNRQRFCTIDTLHYQYVIGNDNEITNMYDSFIEFDFSIKILTDNVDVLNIQQYSIEPLFDPIILIRNSIVETLLNDNGELVNSRFQSIKNNTENRCFISYLFDSKEQHIKLDGFTEISGYMNNINPILINKIDSSPFYKFQLIVPCNKIFEGFNNYRFLDNRKLSFDLFANEINNVFKCRDDRLIITKTTGTIESYDYNVEVYIENASLYLSTFEDIELPKDFKQFSNISIQCDIIKPNELSDISIQWIPKYCIITFNNRIDTIPDIGRIYIESFDNDVFQIYSPEILELWKMTDYCINYGRPESLINYKSWNKKFIAISLDEYIDIHNIGLLKFRIDTNYKTI